MFPITGLVAAKSRLKEKSVVICVTGNIRYVDFGCRQLQGPSSLARIVMATSAYSGTQAVPATAPTSPLLLLLLPIGLEEDAADPDQQPDLSSLALAIRTHPATDNEVQTLCKDLQVLGRSEFKQLLRWRLTLRKALSSLIGGAEKSDSPQKGQHKKSEREAAAGAEKSEGAGDESDSESEKDPEQLLLNEMSAIKEHAEKR